MARRAVGTTSCKATSEKLVHDNNGYNVVHVEDKHNKTCERNVDPRSNLPKFLDVIAIN